MVILLEVSGYILFNGILKIDPERLVAAQLIFQFLIVSTFFTILSVPYDAVVNAHENMLFVAVLGIIEALLKLSIAFFITYTTFDKLASYGLLMASLTVLLLLVRAIYCHWKYKEVRITLGRNFDVKLCMEMTKFAGWSLLGSASSILSNYGQGIVLNMFFGTVVNAAQGIAAQVSGQLGAFAQVMMKALNPALVKSEGEGNREKMLKLATSGGKMSFFLLLFLYIPILIEMPYIFGIWLKEVPDYAIVFCRLLLLRNLIVQLFLTLSSSIAAVGNIKGFQIVRSIINFMPLVICFVLFSKGFAPFYLYLVFIGYSILDSMVVLYFSKRDCGLNITHFFKDIVLRAGVVLVIISLVSFLPLLFMEDGFIRFLTIIGIHGLSFLLVVWNLGFDHAERTFIKKSLKGFLLKRQVLINQ